MFEEPFAHGTSFIHRLDPRVKLAAVVVFSFVTAVSKSFSGPVLGLAAAIFLVVLARLDVRALCRRVAAVNLFILFLWAVLPFTQNEATARVVWSYGFLQATDAGIRLALLITVKSNAILLAFIALASTMDTPSLGRAMTALKVPDKLGFLFLFTYRYVHVIAEKYERLRTAAALRGFVPRTNLHTYRTYGNLLAMVLVRSYDRSRRVYEAMLLRGFDGVFYSLREFCMTSKDKAFLACMLCFSCLLAVLEFFGGRTAWLM